MRKSGLARMFSPRAEFAMALLESSRPIFKTRRRHSTGTHPAALPPDVRRGLASPDSRQKHQWAEPTSFSQATGGAEPRLTSDGKAAALFTGCVGEGLFARVNLATERVLRANGFQVEIPKDQVCCGALHAHAGDLEGARELARKNIAAFASSGSIVTNAGGCGAMLMTYAHLFANDEELATAAADFSSRVRDVSQRSTDMSDQP